MSTRVRLAGPTKKISSRVRPGVLDVRARTRRPVSALIRLDLPTLERPANATSTPSIGGSEAIDPAAALNCHSPANNLRPMSLIALHVCGLGRVLHETHDCAGRALGLARARPSLLVLRPGFGE